MRKIQWFHQHIWVPWRYPKMFWKESVIFELSNAVFEKFSSFLKRKWKLFSNSKIFYEFHSKLFYFSSLEKNTLEFRMAIFCFRISSCVETLIWRATCHSKAENRNFVPRKCECPLGNSSGLILKSGYHAENSWGTRHFYFDALFGHQKMSWWYPKFSQEKVQDFSPLKWRVTRVFWIGGTKMI